MIFVAKPARMAPRDFLDKARAEMALVIPRFRHPGPRAPTVKYKAYRTPSLVAALEAQFHKKCAYCEAAYAPTGYVEIEHYRPKRTYYWLAAEWSNLLPSCKKCNNGKLSKFPLVNPAHRAMTPGQERREKPLLLNPSDPSPRRRPELHLAFNPEDGSIHATLIRGQASPLGATSIEVYRLARKELTDLRRDWASRVRNQVLLCQLAHRGGTGAQKRSAEQGLRELLAPTQPFRALTLQILREQGSHR